MRLPGVEAIFGEPISASMGPAIERLVQDAMAESQQLDWKLVLYSSDIEDKHELAKDICAMANATGGVIVVGVAEVQGRASKSMPFAVADADLRRLRSTVASWTAPLPAFDLVRVDAPDDLAFVVIVIPPSPMAPHGVTAPGEEALRFPVRRGTQTDWLSEAELAISYRARFEGMEERTATLDRIASDAISAYADDACVVALAVVPALPGRGEVTFESVSDTSKWVTTVTRLGFERGHYYSGLRCRPGPSRFDLSGSFNGGHERFNFASLYTDGSGTTASELREPTPQQRPVGIDGNYDFVIDEADLLARVVDGLDLLTTYSADRCGVSGAAVAEVRIRPPIGGQQLRLAHSRPEGLFMHQLGERSVPLPFHSRVGLDLTAMRTSGEALLLGARLVVQGVFQSAGVAEPFPIDREGRLRRRYATANARQWAENRGVAMSDELISD